MKYVIGFKPDYKPTQLVFVRVYQNGKQYVTRMHGKTATQFDTKEQAQACAIKFNIVNPDIRSV